MIPDFQKITLPLLEFLSDGKEHTSKEINDYITKKFHLTEEEKNELLPSGAQTVINNRISWARTYLKKAGLIKSPKRGTFVITEDGKKVLEKKPIKIDRYFLRTIPKFIEWRNNHLPKARKKDFTKTDLDFTYNKTPQELMDYAYQEFIDKLSFELLDKVKNSSPQFFENLVIDLLVKLGYGGSKKEAGKAVGKSGDGGIDGIINEDKLGLDKIYIQAKKWENTIPLKEIRDFAGALLAQKAKKGVFITTSKFPQTAYEYVKNIEHNIILIDGKKLTELMIENDVGLSVQTIYKIKKIDSDYFEENE